MAGSWWPCVCALLLGGPGAGAEWPGYGDAEADRYVLASLNATYRDPLTGELRSDKEEAGKFGEGTAAPAWGVLVAVRTAAGDPTGCSLPLVGHPAPAAPGEPWVALVRRGRCNFDVKVENAFRSNASAVVVYNDKDFPQLEKMRLHTRNISAVFTTRRKGEQWLRLLDNGTRVLLYITVGRQGTLPYPSLNRTSVLFVSISFIVLMVISLAWLVFYYVQRFQYIHAKDRLSKRLSNAAKKALSKIPTKSLKSGDRELQGDGECCAVCIEPYKATDVLRILPCGHEFHKTCIDPWLLEHRTCPMCKMDILKHYGFVFTGSQESILHMDIEEVVSPDSLESVQHRAASTQLPSVHQTSGASSASSESRGRTPSPCAEQCFPSPCARDGSAKSASSVGSRADAGTDDELSNARDCELESCASTPSRRAGDAC
ncbi:E3 ubiquitin-protein ligase goliath-like isoform X2 [Bacillus rossius redtenbacheri]|uniref:E3 ubiquitin-protein ligase goliath-like isoform X2 n=1 Tax=Bacillus rossius redtenbacheri TaxID=93214 RepID=UPI002FDD3D5F